MWQPTSEADLRVAVEEGTFAESSNLDVKAETGSTDGARRETAKDLASFAIDGGALLIGIAEDKNSRTFSLAPVPLNDLVEKIEQIAANRIDPPLHLRVREIATAEDPNQGYLFVEVPPSPHAPHMVSGVYYARGERTTRRLTDAEVVRLHESRRRDDQLIQDLLTAEILRDPVPRPLRAHGHLYLVAEPSNSRSGMARHIARSDNNSAMFQLRHASERFISQDLWFPPLPSDASHWARRARGAAFTTLSDGRSELGTQINESDLVDIELEEDGGIRVTLGRMTDHGRDDAGGHLIMDGLAVAYALRLVHWAREVSTRCDYRGKWSFGLSATGLLGLASSAHQKNYGGGLIRMTRRAEPYDRDTYEAVTSAHLTELEDDPGGVAERLVGGLLRGLGSDDVYLSYLSKAESQASD